MIRIDDRTTANMDVALEQVCKNLPNGGDHETRKYVAEKLIQAAKKGNTALGAFETVARRALLEVTRRRSA
jgi:hypothetical protein